MRTLSPLMSSSVTSISPSMRTLSPIRLVNTSIRSAYWCGGAAPSDAVEESRTTPIVSIVRAAAVASL